MVAVRHPIPLIATSLVALCCLIVEGGCSPESDLPGGDPVSVGGGDDKRGRVSQGDAGVASDVPAVMPDCETDDQCMAQLPDATPCRPGRCFLGECEPALADDGAPCDDGDLCTASDYCAAGVCLPGKATDCDDGNPCTDDACDPKAGLCSNVPNGAICDVDGGCAVGVCEAGDCNAQSKLFLALHVAEAPRAVTAVVALDDGRFAVVANVELANEVTAARWLRLDGAGAMQVQGEVPLAWAADAAAMPGGGVLVVGRVRLPSGDLQGRAVALAQAATVDWMRDYGGQADDAIQAIAPAPGGGWVAAGTTHSKGQGSGDLWLLRLNPQGHPMLDFSYGSTDVEAAEAVTATSAGGYVIAGTQTSKSGNVDGVVLAIDPEASLIWMAQYGGPHVERPLAVVQRADGTLLFAGARGLDAAGHQAFWLGALALDGSKLWSRFHKAGGDVTVASMVGAVDGGAVIVGADRSVDPAHPDTWQPRALRVDAMGNLQWTRTWAWEAGSALLAVARLADDGMIVAGRRTLPAGASVAMLRTDPWGHADCASAGGCAQLDVSACDDGLPCTTDTCEGGQGCGHSWLVEGSPCAVGLACAASKCTP